MIEIHDIKTIERNIKKARNKKASAEGAIKVLLKQLKDNHNLDSVEDAEVFVEKEERRLAAEEKKLNKKLDVLKDECGL